MGMFDYYEPDPIPCPSCGVPLDGWQGKDGPCLLLVWKQGYPSPVEHRVDADVQNDPAALDELRLPATFGVYAWCAECLERTAAVGTTSDQTWSLTTVMATTAGHATDLGDGWRLCACGEAWTFPPTHAARCPRCKVMTTVA